MQVNKIYQGNNIDILRSFEDGSVNCCITSPPYYGLRDYGTGKWVGGDPNCDHVIGSFGSSCSVGTHKKMKELGIQAPGKITKHVCPKCGAVRVNAQIGLEETPEEYIERLVEIFREVKRLLKDDGTLWVNIGDTYYGSVGGRGSDYHDDRTDIVQSGNKGFNDMLFAPTLTKKRDDLKPKDLIGIPWMLAFALRADGWYLRQDIIWHKPNPMPESVKDRCTKCHEYIFLLSKSPRYYFDYEAMQEEAICKDDRRLGMGRIDYGGKRENYKDIGVQKSFVGITEKRNKRDVWTVIPAHYKEAHFATFPEELIYPMVVTACPKDGIVLDPFMGSGTVGVVAKQNNRKYVGCELNEEYVKMAENRIRCTKRRLF